MQIQNDNSCSWINDLVPRTNIKTLEKNQECDWLIVGAGFTGLSAARKLGQLYSNQKIILVDAQLAGEGASGRNSGYLVDTTLNDGFTSNHSVKSSLRIEGANGLKLSLYFTFKFKFFCILSDLGSPKIDLPPKALGPNSILP